jgi:RNA polymerase sigma-70 factor (ECF subfamily)
VSRPESDLSEDRAWLDAFRRGEEEALERVFRTYAPLVATILQRGTRTEGGFAPGVDLDRVQDLLHDVFVRALNEKTRQSYDGLRPYGPFLAQIARRTLIDHHRKHTNRERRTELSDDLEGYERAVDDWRPGLPPPDAAAVSNESRAKVRGFLATLPEEDRKLVQLRFVEGLSQRDAAEAGGTSRQRLRTWEKQIREKLRQYLQQSAGEEP